MMDQAINRFASTFAGAFKAFYLYRQDNKAIDDIMQNVLSRFQAAAKDHPLLKIGITNRSLVFEGDVIGANELARHLAVALRTLGFKEIIFRAPLQSRHFFMILNILSSRDSNEVKFEKLIPFIGDEEEKPITLISITANSLLLRMSDELLEKQMAPLLVPTAQGGTGFIEALTQAQLDNMPDLYTWVCVKAEPLKKSLKAFVRNLTDAAREGYFPWERYLKVFPMPMPLKHLLFEKLTAAVAPRKRILTDLGLKFKSGAKPTKKNPIDLRTTVASFSKEELRIRNEMVSTGTQQSGIQELDLAESLLSEQGTNFSLGLRFLIRFLGQKNPVTGQEKALKLGIGVWLRMQQVGDDMSVMSLMSALRQNLAAAHNMTLTLFPLRTLTIESEMFGKITQYIISLGEVALPALVESLDAEQDRGMRRKLCHVITLIARERGVDFLLESTPKASTFLLRNIIMILGDLRTPGSVPTLMSLVTHQQKMIRLEIYRSLGKIATPDAVSALRQISRVINDKEEKDSLNTLLTRFPA